jgi:hypothetical protein
LAGLLDASFPFIGISLFIIPLNLLIAPSKDFFIHLAMQNKPINTQFKQDTHKDSSEITALLLF